MELIKSKKESGERTKEAEVKVERKGGGNK